MTPRDRDALERIVQSLDRIDAYVARIGQGWVDDEMVIDAVAKRIEEIGEDAKRLSTEVLAAMPAVDWVGVKGARDVLAHDYDEIEPSILADVVQNDLPGLRVVVEGALKNAPVPSPDEPPT